MVPMVHSEMMYLVLPKWQETLYEKGPCLGHFLWVYFITDKWSVIQVIFSKLSPRFPPIHPPNSPSTAMPQVLLISSLASSSSADSSMKLVPRTRRRFRNTVLPLYLPSKSTPYVFNIVCSHPISNHKQVSVPACADGSVVSSYSLGLCVSSEQQEGCSWSVPRQIRAFSADIEGVQDSTAVIVDDLDVWKLV